MVSSRCWQLISGSSAFSKTSLNIRKFTVHILLKDDAVKVLHSICQQIWKTQQWPQDWKRSVFTPGTQVSGPVCPPQPEGPPLGSHSGSDPAWGLEMKGFKFLLLVL